MGLSRIIITLAGIVVYFTGTNKQISGLKIYMPVVVYKAGTVEVCLLFNKEITVKMKKRKDKK